MPFGLAAAADGELDKLGLGHLEVIGTRFIDEHHEIHDYPGDKSDDEHKDESSEDSDYHHAIYDHVDISKDDYSDFGEGIKPRLHQATCCRQHATRCMYTATDGQQTDRNNFVAGIGNKLFVAGNMLLQAACCRQQATC